MRHLPQRMELVQSQLRPALSSLEARSSISKSPGRSSPTIECLASLASRLTQALESVNAQLEKRIAADSVAGNQSSFRKLRKLLLLPLAIQAMQWANKKQFVAERSRCRLTSLLCARQSAPESTSCETKDGRAQLTFEVRKILCERRDATS